MWNSWLFSRKHLKLFNQKNNNLKIQIFLEITAFYGRLEWRFLCWQLLISNSTEQSPFAEEESLVEKKTTSWVLELNKDFVFWFKLLFISSRKNINAPLN